MPTPANKRETLLRYLRTQRATDAEIKRLLRDAARAIASAVEDSAPTGFGDAIRRAQLRIHANAISQRLWTRIGLEVTDGKVRAVGAATQGATKDLAELLAGLPPEVRSALLEGAEKAASGAVDRAIARAGGTGRFELSARVYRNAALTSGQVDRLINSGIARGLSAREMATEVRRFILPTTPGGTSYAALRLGRTELNNSYHAASVNYWDESPFVDGIEWNLSRSHPHADQCDEFANEDSDRLGAGVFRKGNVPAKPHPQCLCFVVPVTPDDDTIVRNFEAGRYDAFLNRIAA